MDIPLPSIDLARVVLHTDDRVNQADADASSSDAAAWKLLEQRIMPGAAPPACSHSAVQGALQDTLLPCLLPLHAMPGWRVHWTGPLQIREGHTRSGHALLVNAAQGWQLSWLALADGYPQSMLPGVPIMTCTWHASCRHRDAARTCLRVPHIRGQASDWSPLLRWRLTLLWCVGSERPYQLGRPPHSLVGKQTRALPAPPSTAHALPRNEAAAASTEGSQPVHFRRRGREQRVLAGGARQEATGAAGGQPGGGRGGPARQRAPAQPHGRGAAHLAPARGLPARGRPWLCRPSRRLCAGASSLCRAPLAGHKCGWACFGLPDGTGQWGCPSAHC